MSFPDFTNQEDPFQNPEQPGVGEHENQNEFSPIEDNQNQFTRLENNQSDIPPKEGNKSSIPEIDEEEQKRLEQRMLEENERRQKITAKMELELKLKNEKREEAIAFINEFEK